MTSRAVGLFEGVGGSTPYGHFNENLPLEMNMKVQDQLSLRLENRKAQQYDRDVQLTLATDVEPRLAGWLRNVVAKCFLQAQSLGAATLGLCHLSGNRVIYGSRYPTLTIPPPPPNKFTQMPAQIMTSIIPNPHQIHLDQIKPSPQ